MSEIPIRKLILVPAVITLGVTLVRLLGELSAWSATFFNRAAGGGGAIVGIVWLVPVFGVYFALKLAAAGLPPAKAGAAVGWAVLGFAVVPVAGLVTGALGVPDTSLVALGLFAVASVAGGALAFRGWPALGRILLAYGVAARIPVVIVMFFAILGNWGTHYDARPPGFPEMGRVVTWLLIGVLPQLTIWIWFTVAVGILFGAIGFAVAGKQRAQAA